MDATEAARRERFTLLMRAQRERTEQVVGLANQLVSLRPDAHPHSREIAIDVLREAIAALGRADAELYQFCMAEQTVLAVES